MKRNELFTHYSMTECIEQEKIFNKLDKLTKSGKIEFIYEFNNERFKLIDLELSDKEITKLANLFYDNDVVPDLDFSDIDDNFTDDMGFFEEYE